RRTLWQGYAAAGGLLMQRVEHDLGVEQDQEGEVGPVDEVGQRAQRAAAARGVAGVEVEGEARLKRAVAVPVDGGRAAHALVLVHVRFVLQHAFAAGEVGDVGGVGGAVGVHAGELVAVVHQRVVIWL